MLMVSSSVASTPKLRIVENHLGDEDEHEWLVSCVECISSRIPSVALIEAKTMVSKGANSQVGSGWRKGRSFNVVLEVDRVCSIVDFLMVKFGFLGAGEILRARASLIRCSVEDLKREVAEFERWGSTEWSTFDFVVVKGWGLGLYEDGISAANMILAAKFLTAEVGLSGPEVADCFFRAPNFFNHNFHAISGTMKERVEYLANILGDSGMRHVVLKSPSLLSAKLESLEAKLAFLRSRVGIPVERLPGLLSMQVRLFKNSITTMELAWQSWVDVGVSPDLAKTYPLCVLMKNLSQGKYSLKLWYLTEVLGQNASEYLSKDPIYMARSLDYVIGPRIAYLKEIKCDIASDKSLSFLRLTPTNFDKRYRSRHPNGIGIVEFCERWNVGRGPVFILDDGPTGKIESTNNLFCEEGKKRIYQDLEL